MQLSRSRRARLLVYKVILTKEERKQIAFGNATLLLQKLRESDEKIIRDLKSCKDKDHVAFIQGASRMIDELIDILESDR